MLCSNRIIILQRYNRKVRSFLGELMPWACSGTTVLARAPI